MAQNPFNKSDIPNPNLNRNAFDLSFANNLTMNFGGLYPVFCKPVIPGDTFKIKSAFGLRFLPTLFPVQTRMRADLHFFYVRNRNLWDEWQNFMSNFETKKSLPVVGYFNQFKSSSVLTDCMGLPTSVIADRDVYLNPEIRRGYTTMFASPNTNRNVDFLPSITDATTQFNGILSGDFPTYINRIDRVSPVNRGTYSYAFAIPFTNFNTVSTALPYTLLTRFLEFAQRGDIGISVDSYGLNGSAFGGLDVPEDVEQFILNNSIVNFFLTDNAGNVIAHTNNRTTDSSLSNSNSSDLVWNGNTISYGPNCYVYAVITLPNFPGIGSLDTSESNYLNFYFDFMYQDSNTSGFAFLIHGTSDSPFSLNDIASASLSDISEQLPNGGVNALRFRAYESIYNSFYRDMRNNPYRLNGEIVPNTYLPTKDGGFDSTPYLLHYRNWENDFLTTATQSPQQGQAPLVGISDTGSPVLLDDDGNEYRATLNINPETKTMEIAVGENVPGSVMRKLVNVASSGISINDFRNVNAFQRYLETNQRVGLRYKDIIEGRFGVNISYAELDMPEFIGGVTEYVSVNQINQTTDTGDTPLGSYAGQLSCVGQSKHEISHYCDEHGYIIGILSVVPVPVYTDILDKDFLKSDPLDFWTPEFNHIGNQAIPYAEVSPLLAALNSSVKLTDTFGYQRPWYDYLRSLDEAHGLFRTSLNNFVMRRTFSSSTIPKLDSNFLTVHPSQLNNIFATDTDNSDKILGQLFFDVTAIRPISKYGIPRLE